MAEFGFYDIVRIRRTATTIRLGIADQLGVIGGISTPEVLAVVVDEEAYSLDAMNLEPMGEKADPELFRSAGRISVRPQRYGPEDDPE
ncbi:hypothetical protein [Kribbella sp. NPDC051620]|uniref:hypothetical protein n=1 Tax=Kribbella sp. NPDC051620 TaxID=3364120 RepID=UPI0037B4B384